MTTPFNFITLTLSFYDERITNYPLDFIVTFAVNGAMVVVVFFCLAKPGIARHTIMINLAILLAGFFTLLLPFVVVLSGDNQALAFWLTIPLMFLVGIAQATALTQTLSYMSYMPERFMALNSMGIGFSGLLSLLVNAILQLIFDSKSQDFTRTTISYFICFLIMAGASSMYFVEKNSNYARYFIELAEHASKQERAHSKA